MSESSNESLSESLFEGRLSRVEYDRWCWNYLQQKGLDVSVNKFLSAHEVRIEQEFDLLSESDFVLDNFFNLDEVFRRSVESYAGYHCSIIHIEEFVRLAIEVQSLGIEFENDSHTSVGMIAFALRELTLKSSGKSKILLFDSTLEEYLFVFDRDESFLLVNYIVEMLAIVFGVSLVLDVLLRWESAAYPGEPEDFVAVVRDWENLKMYPIEWAVHVVRSSRDD